MLLRASLFMEPHQALTTRLGFGWFLGYCEFGCLVNAGCLRENKHCKLKKRVSYGGLMRGHKERRSEPH